MTRFNTKDSFEQVYLRYNQAKRDFQNVKSKDLKDPEFIKICKYAAGKCFYGNEAFLLSNGYDIDDINSLATIFGACYLGYEGKTEAYDKRRSNLMMIAFILQRINRFIVWTSAKFQVSETVSFFPVEHQDIYSDSPFMIEGILMYGEAESKDDMEVLMDLIEDSAECESKSKLKKIEDNISKLKVKIKEEKAVSKKTHKENKLKISSDPQKYSKSLAWYASTKHVAYDVRKAARKYCKIHNIDYRQIVQDLINNNSYNAIDFDLK